MLKHKLNIEKSKDLFKACEDNIYIKDCYRNVFRTIGVFPDNWHEGKWKVAYGYVEAFPSVCVRHCFIVDDEGDAIDPTAMLWGEIPKDYLSFKILDANEWLDLIVRNKRYVALEKEFEREEALAREYAEEYQLTLIG